MDAFAYYHSTHFPASGFAHIEDWYYTDYPQTLMLFCPYQLMEHIEHFMVGIEQPHYHKIASCLREVLLWQWLWKHRLSFTDCVVLTILLRVINTVDVAA